MGAGTYIFMGMNLIPMRRLPVFFTISAALVLVLLMSGCAGKLPAPPAESSVNMPAETAAVMTTEPAFIITMEPALPVTPAQTPVWTYRAPPTTLVTIVPAADLDRAFVEAAAICFQKTPVIADITTHMAFLTCMQKTPNPAGDCARGYRDTVLRYMNEDDTTAGYSRETHNTHLARDAFNRSMTYDATSQQFVPC